MKYFYLVTCLLVTQASFGQTDRNVYGLGSTEFGRINLNDSSYFMVNASETADNVYESVTFNAADGWYIWQWNMTFSASIKVMEVPSGNMLQDIPIDPYAFHSLEYNETDNTIYGIGYYSYGKFSLTDSSYTVIPSPVDCFSLAVHTSFDQAHQRFICKSITGMTTKDTIMVLDLAGNIVQKVEVDSNSVNNFEYDPAGNKVYGVGRYGFVAVDLDDSSMTVLNPAIQERVQWHSTFDFEHHHYIYHTGGTLLNMDTIVVISAITGNVLQKITTSQQFWAPEYDNHKQQVMGISSREQKETINVYPVPVSDQLYLQLPFKGEGFMVTITNILGETCVQQTFEQGNNAVLNVRMLENGTYLVQVKTERGELFAQKIVKQ